MSNNTRLNVGNGGDIIATDDIDGVKHQLVKLEYGGENQAVAVSDDSPLPVSTLSAGIMTVNSSSTPLNAGQSFMGEAVDVSKYSSVIASCKTDQDGFLYMEFSADGTNWDSILTYSVLANVNEVHRLSATRQYFRVRFTNSSASNQTFFRLQALYGSQQLLTAGLNTTVRPDSDSLITRSILMGQLDSGFYKYVPVTAEGHLEVALHSPILPFGSVHTEKLTPIFQTDAVYGINAGQVLAETSLSGVATAVDSVFVVSTGVTQFSQGVILGRKRLRYRAGQGVVGRFAGRFTTPVPYSYQIAGFGHAEDGVYFGYADVLGETPEFGILYVNRGVRETRTLTVTTGATVSGNVTITLNSVPYTIAVTNASNIQRTVWEISIGVYAGWDAYPTGATVVFVRKSAGAADGTYSFAAGATGAAATIAQTKAGVASTDLFIPQSEWNGDKLDGTGASGITIDPTKGNVFQIGIQYLGFGTITFKVEVAAEDGNNADYVVVHTLRLPNTLLTTSFGNPSFPFTMAAYSAGSTTDLAVRVGSFAGFVEGEKVLHGNRFTYVNSLTTVGATNYQALFTIMNARYYAGRSNQAVINILSVTGALKHTSPCIYYLIRGGALAGNPNFITLSPNSCSVYDTAATTVTFSSGDQLLWTGHLGDTGELDHHFGGTSELNMEEITLQPGQWITLAARAVTGTPSFVTGSINTREDQ